METTQMERQKAEEAAIRALTRAVRERFHDPKNRAKGRWDDLDEASLLSAAVVEMGELVTALGHDAMRHEAGDVAAFLAMLVDKIERRTREPSVIFTCQTCGSAEVQMTAWVRMNTLEVLDDEGPSDDFYCPKCDDVCVVFADPIEE